MLRLAVVHLVAFQRTELWAIWCKVHVNHCELSYTSNIKDSASGRYRPVGLHSLCCKVSWLIRTSAHEQWEALSNLGELITSQATNRDEFIKECQNGRLDGVVAAYRTFQSISITGRFDKGLVTNLPKSWRYLAHCGAGYDQIVPEACSQ